MPEEYFVFQKNPKLVRRDSLERTYLPYSLLLFDIFEGLIRGIKIVEG